MQRLNVEKSILILVSAMYDINVASSSVLPEDWYIIKVQNVDCYVYAGDGEIDGKAEIVLCTMSNG